MARKNEIQYIRYYTDGSAARQLEPKLPQRKKQPVRPRKPRTVQVVEVDLLAVCGIVTAAVLLVVMAVGMVRLRAVQQRVQTLSGYVTQLEQEHHVLQKEYMAGYDLEDVHQQALLLGMVPAEAAETIIISVPQVEAEQAPSMWERIADFFRDLSA